MATEGGRRRRRGAEEWRALMNRFAQSDQDVVPFCQAEGIGTASFHRWRRLLGAPGETKRKRQTTFLDLGDVAVAPAAGRLELKLDLGSGRVLQLVLG